MEGLGLIEPQGESGSVRLQKEGINPGAETIHVTIEGMKPANRRAGLRRALKGNEAEGARLAQREEKTYLVRTPGKRARRSQA